MGAPDHRWPGGYGGRPTRFVRPTDTGRLRVLGRALYGDDDRSLQEVRADAHRFSKFDFLTNWGESFDGNKGFLLHSGDGLRVLFRRGLEPVAARRITEDGLRHAVQGFLGWVEAQRRSGDATEAKWLSSDDVEGMLDWLRRSAPTMSEHAGRKLRLFDCACCRRIWSILTDKRSRKAVEIAEKFADGMASEVELAAARQDAKDAASAIQGQHGSYAAEGCATWAAVYAAPSASAAYNTRAAIHFSTSGDVTLAMRETTAQVAMLRDIVGNPFRPVTLDPSWLAPAVVSLAQSIYDTHSLERMPQLAIALEKAGCTNKEVLDHCRGPGPHVKGCWLLDLVLGKE